MARLAIPGKDDAAIVKDALRDYKVYVKVNPRSGMAIYPRVSRDYNLNVWDNTTAREICTILNRLGYCSVTGSAIIVYTGNVREISGIYKIAP